VASRPSISVIIPARDAAPTLDRTLSALRAQTLKEPFEVIVVDDGSVDGTASVAHRYAPLVRLIRSERSEGPGAARNRGVGAACAPVLAFTDSDCFPARDWLATGLRALAGADLVQGAVAPDPDAPRTPFDRTVIVARDGGFYQTANVFLRRELFHSLGGFRDWAREPRTGEPRPGSPDRRRARASRTPIGEDTLFAWRARRDGARVAFAADALVHHAVVPGGVRDEIADRLHWSTDMPGLARLVPELRQATFYRRWFFHRKTARFDVALAAGAAALVSRRPAWLALAAPYAHWVAVEAGPWPAGRARARFVLGSLAIDGATCWGLLTGSVRWRTVLL
jgi:glycosyltransferase involved in cell wall biosynthesis